MSVQTTVLSYGSKLKLHNLNFFQIYHNWSQINLKHIHIYSVITIKSLIPQKILKTKAEKFCFLKEELQDILRLPII